MNQFKEIYAWKCIKCGRTLLTGGGAKRHRESCKYVIPVLDGQISFEEREEIRNEN